MDTVEEVDSKPFVVVGVVVHRCTHIGIAAGPDKEEPKAGVGYRHSHFVGGSVHRNPSCSMSHIAYTVGEEWPWELVEQGVEEVQTNRYPSLRLVNTFPGSK